MRCGRRTLRGSCEARATSRAPPARRPTSRLAGARRSPKLEEIDRPPAAHQVLVQRRDRGCNARGALQRGSCSLERVLRKLRRAKIIEGGDLRLARRQSWPWPRSGARGPRGLLPRWPKAAQFPLAARLDGRRLLERVVRTLWWRAVVGRAIRGTLAADRGRGLDLARADREVGGSRPRWPGAAAARTRPVRSPPLSLERSRRLF